MQLGRVIGRVRAVVKDPRYSGLTLVVMVPLGDDLRPGGPAFVAADPLGAALNQVVYWESSQEARFSVADNLTPLDAGIVGLVDRLAQRPDLGID